LETKPERPIFEDVDVGTMPAEHTLGWSAPLLHLGRVDLGASSDVIGFVDLDGDGAEELVSTRLQLPAGQRVLVADQIALPSVDLAELVRTDLGPANLAVPLAVSRWGDASVAFVDPLSRALERFDGSGATTIATLAFAPSQVGPLPSGALALRDPSGRLVVGDVSGGSFEERYSEDLTDEEDPLGLGLPVADLDGDGGAELQFIEDYRLHSLSFAADGSLRARFAADRELATFRLIPARTAWSPQTVLSLHRDRKIVVRRLEAEQMRFGDARAWSYVESTDLRAALAADLSGNGLDELIVVTKESALIATLREDGQLVWLGRVEGVGMVDGDLGSSRIFAADLDGDGADELAVSDGEDALDIYSWDVTRGLANRDCTADPEDAPASSLAPIEWTSAL